MSTTATRDIPPRPKELTVPADWVSEAFDKNWVLAQYPKEMKQISDSKLNMLYGTSVSMVVAAFLKKLFACRKSGAPASLLVDMVFSVFVSQTVSREWARIYSTLGNDTMFKTFEIMGNRTADPKVPLSSWVVSSSMNATAVGILGHLIMASARRGSSLGAKAEEMGTIFAPASIEDHPSSEYVKICNQTNKTLSAADFAAVKTFEKHAGHLVTVIEDILESSSSSVDEVVAALADLPIKKF